MVISMNNVVGGGDSWVCDANGIPVVYTLTAGVNTKTFTCPSSEYGYEPYISCAADTKPPGYTSMTFNGNVCTIVTESVTTAQMGGASGTQCKLKLRIIK